MEWITRLLAERPRNEGIAVHERAASGTIEARLCRLAAAVAQQPARPVPVFRRAHWGTDRTLRTAR